MTIALHRSSLRRSYWPERSTEGRRPRPRTKGARERCGGNGSTSTQDWIPPSESGSRRSSFKHPLLLRVNPVAAGSGYLIGTMSRCNLRIFDATSHLSTQHLHTSHLSSTQRCDKRYVRDTSEMRGGYVRDASQDINGKMRGDGTNKMTLGENVW